LLFPCSACQSLLSQTTEAGIAVLVCLFAKATAGSIFAVFAFSIRAGEETPVQSGRFAFGVRCEGFESALAVPIRPMMMTAAVTMRFIGTSRLDREGIL
jgi:hypothetical protein